MLIKRRDKRGSSVSRSRGTRDGALIIRLSLFSSAECHVRDKIQTIPTNKGSLEGQRGWNIFEEWYCLTPPPPSPSLPHTPPPSPSSRPSALKRSPSRGSSGQRESRDERMIKDGKNTMRVSVVWDCARVWWDFFFLDIYNEVDTLKLSADLARIWICAFSNLSRDAAKLLFDSDLSNNQSTQQMCFDSIAFL